LQRKLETEGDGGLTGKRAGKRKWGKTMSSERKKKNRRRSKKSDYDFTGGGGGTLWAGEREARRNGKVRIAYGKKHDLGQVG